MDEIKEVVEDPIKSKIMSFFQNKTRVDAEELGKEIGSQGEELQGALDFLVSSNLLTRKDNHYKKTQGGLKISYALRGYEEAAAGLIGFDTEIPLSGLILDIGCGAGYYLNIAEKYSPNIVGADINPEFLYIASLKSKAMLIRADAQFLPFKSNTFDLIICYSVIPAVKDEPKVIAEASRVIKEGGTVLLRVYAVGHYLRIMFDREERGMRVRLGAVAGILNTFVYWLTGKKLRFKTYIYTFQTETRMRKILREHQIETIKIKRIGRVFKGLPAFIHLEGQKLAKGTK